MEDQDKYFYQRQLDFFGENSPPPHQESQPDPLSWFNSPEKQGEKIQQEKPLEFRAYNPMDQLKNIPEDRRHEFMFFLHNKKTFNGIQHFFNFGEENQHREEFLENIECNAFGDEEGNDFEIDKLFRGQMKETHLEAIQSTLLSLHQDLQTTHQKVMGGINLNRAISNAFYEHFENFALVLNSSHFLAQFQHNFKMVVQQCRKMKGPGTPLFTTLHQFWQKSFKDLINQIWKYSSKFTLNFFKNNPSQEVDSSNNASNNSQIRSESSNTMGSKQKRKGWNKDETEVILKCIESNIIFSQSVIKSLATQFNRSVSSVASKIQKLIKSRKGQESQEDSLFRKTIETLRRQQEGLTRESIIDKINQNYEMGYGGQWEKSVGQLLSSKKDFIKIRGKHKLINPNLFQPLTELDGDRSKLTFKDKVVQVLLSLPKCEGQLRVLVDTYIQMFGQGQAETEVLFEQRRKTIDGNISKTLSRYQIFDTSNSKTKYLLNPLMHKLTDNNGQMQVEDFLSF